MYDIDKQAKINAERDKRAVGNIDKNIKLNKAIWEMATEIQALKGEG